MPLSSLCSTSTPSQTMNEKVEIEIRHLVKEGRVGKEPDVNQKKDVGKVAEVINCRMRFDQAASKWCDMIQSGRPEGL